MDDNYSVLEKFNDWVFPVIFSAQVVIMFPIVYALEAEGYTLVGTIIFVFSISFMFFGMWLCGKIEEWISTMREIERNKQKEENKIICYYKNDITSKP